MRLERPFALVDNDDGSCPFADLPADDFRAAPKVDRRGENGIARRD
jgi:hypothetical protein